MSFLIIGKLDSSIVLCDKHKERSLMLNKTIEDKLREM